MKNLKLLIILLILSALSLDAKSFKSGGFGGGSSSKSFFSGGSKSSSFGSGSSNSNTKSSYNTGPSYGGGSTSSNSTKSSYSSGSSDTKTIPSYSYEKKADTVSMNSFDKARIKEENGKSSKLALDSFKEKQNTIFKGTSKAPETKADTFFKKDTKTNTSSASYNTGTNNSSYKSPKYSDRYERRSTFYSTHTPPSYYNQSRFAPSYGSWDGFFLGYMLSDSLGDLGRFLHNNSNDSGVSEWKRAMEEEAKSNAQLKAKLDAANAEVARLEKEGVPKQNGYIPSTVDTDLALNPTFVEKNKEKVYENTKENEEEESSHGFAYTVGFLSILGAAGWFIFGRRTL